MNTSAKALNAQEQTQKTTASTNAWGKGINPITKRPISTNGTPAPKTYTSSKAPSGPAKDASAMSNTNLAFLAANMKGLNATLTHKNGDRYSGIFSSLGDKGYTIKMARKNSSSGKQSNGVTEEQVGEGPDRALTIEVSDVVDLKVDGVRLDKSQGRGQNGTSSNFRTDTDISSGRTVRERDLQKWEGAPDSQVDMSLGGRLGDWDQFAAHKQMTGRDSTYDENNYTTKLDTSAPGYKEKLARAEKIAREIENSTTNNAHQAEERGQINTRDDGIDEEAKYSGVQRNFQPLASGQPNRYTPPARRAAGGPPPAVSTPADDPAIISSSRPESAAPKQAPAPVKPAEVAVTTTSAPKDPAPVATASTADKPTPSVPAIKSFASTQSPSTRVQPKEGGATETVEKDVVNAFKQFHAVEKMRIQEHLQSQRSAARRDKAVKLNDLKKFAENFKLNTEVPTDLIPILAKDKKKQQEIMDRAKKNTDETKASTPPRATTTATATTVPTDPKSAKVTANRAEPGVTSPQAPNDRQTQQRSRPNQPGFNSTRGVPAHMQQQMGGMPARHNPPGQLGQRLANQQQHRQNALAHQHQQMPPQDPRMPPSGPAATSSGMQSPTSAFTRWNPKADFKPNLAAATFVPSSNPSNGSSPVREPATKPPPPAERKPTQSNLFEGRTEGRKGVIPASERISLKTHFNPVARMKKDYEAAVEQGTNKFNYTANGGIPEGYRTAPVWEVPEENKEKKITDCFATVRKPSVSPQHSMLNQQPYQHQLPFHPQQGGPMQHGATPQHTPRHHAVQLNHGGPGTPRYDEPHRMQYSQSTSSVQPSPQQMAQYPPFNGQAPQPTAFYGHQGFPAPGGQPMFARQSSQGQQFYTQPPNGHMMAMPPNGVQYQMPPGMMFVPQQNQMFQQQGNGMPPQAPNGYPSPGPRGIPMSQQGSQQGHPQQMVYMAQPGQAPLYPQAHGGNMTPMRQPYAQLHQQPYPNGPQHFQQQPHRATPSGSFVQPNMMAGPPQGMVPNGAPMGPETVEDGK